MYIEDDDSDNDTNNLNIDQPVSSSFLKAKRELDFFINFKTKDL